MEYDPDERRPLMRTISEDGVLDQPQTPVFYDTSHRKRRVACFIILLTEMLERLAYYGITANFVLFLNLEPYSWMSFNAMHVFYAFTAISYIFSVFGGLIADTVLGRFNTIAVSYVIYVIGIVFFVLMGYGSWRFSFCSKLCGVNVSSPRTNLTWVEVEEQAKEEYMEEQQTVLCLGPLMLAVCLTAIGGGSVRANLSPFGADQVKHEGPDMIRTFFNWFYWSINIGSLIAIIGVAYVQQNINFFYGYLIVAAALLMALVVFVCGRCCCIFLTREPTGSVLPNTFKIIIQAFRRHHLTKQARRLRNSHMLTSAPKITFLDMAKRRYGGSFHDSMVEDVKSLKKVIAVFVLLVPYWMVYYQMQSTFQVQGLHMRFVMPDHNKQHGIKDSFQFPVAWLSVFDVAVVIILLPVLDRCVYPCLVRRGYSVSLFWRLLLGMVFSMLAVLVAGGLELYRKNCVQHTPNCTVNQTVKGDTVYNSADIWIFYQIPQYALIGVSEVLASVAGLEFAYSHAPKSMQGLIMGLFCLSNGIGSLCGSALVAFFSIPHIGWLQPKDKGNINRSRLAYYFFVLAGIQLLALIIFSCVNVQKILSGQGAVQTGVNTSRYSSTSKHVQRSTSGSESPT